MKIKFCKNVIKFASSHIRTFYCYYGQGKYMTLLLPWKPNT